MQIGLRDFRAFADTGLIDVRPLTFLVGENSSGKTSLLSALNYVWRLQERLQAASFNRAPFDLGTFDEIVHSVKGRARPGHFCITVENDIAARPSRRVIYQAGRAKAVRERISGRAKLRLTFGNNVGDTVLIKVQFDFNDYQLFIEFDDDIRAVLYLSGKLLIDSSKGDRRLPLPRTGFSPAGMDFAFIEVFLSRLLYDRGDPSDAPSAELVEAVSTVQGALEGLTESFPRAIFASAPVRSRVRTH